MPKKPAAKPAGRRQTSRRTASSSSSRGFIALFSKLKPRKKSGRLVRSSLSLSRPQMIAVAAVVASVGAAFLHSSFAATSYSLWADTTLTPAMTATWDKSSVELGVKFTSDQAGTISGIKFYKASTNTGTHTGSLWSTTGALLATATFVNETTSGWQTVKFATPVTVVAGQQYIATYHTFVGNYSVTNNYFSTKGYDRAPLHAPMNTSTSPNGVFRAGAGFPNDTYAATNYWVDVTFEPTATPTPTVAPAIVTTTATPVPTATPTPTTTSTATTTGRTYPLHTNINATTFWVGEQFQSTADGSQVCSAYDSQWQYHFFHLNTGVNKTTGCYGSYLGGCDALKASSSGSCNDTNSIASLRTPANGYWPSGLPAIYENPFYLDLPYDDYNQSDATDTTGYSTRCKDIPWANDTGYAGHCTDQTFSYMKNRWVKVMANNQACYAQIEDAGPADDGNGNGNYADRTYVFSTTDARPYNTSYNSAGMDVSPALGACLHGAFNQDLNVSWRFVDAVDVPAGPWKHTVTTTKPN